MADSSLLRRAAIAAASLLAVGCVALAVVAALTDAGEVDLRLDPGWLVLGAVALAGMQLAHIALWRGLLGALGTPLPARPARAIWSVSNLARYVPTGLLAPAARIALSARAGIPRSATLAASAYELALSLLGAAALSAWLLVRQGPAVRWTAAVVVAGMVVALHPRVQAWALGLAQRRLGRPLALPPLAPAVSIRVTALYALSFVVGGFGLCAVVQGLHGLSADDLPTVLAVVAFGYVAGVLGFLLPGGIGVREAAIAAALATVVPFALGVAAAIVLRLLQLAVELLLAGAFSARAGRSRSFMRVNAATYCALCGGAIPVSRSPRFVKDGLDIVECPSCGLLARRTLPSDAEVREIYEAAYFLRPKDEDDAQGYLDYVADEPIHRLAARKRLDRLARHVRGGRVLDVGCASGFFLAEARDRGFVGVGVDVAPAMTAVARERFGLDVQTTTFTDASLEGTFDLVTMWDYIEHTTDPRADVRRAAERVAPDGVLALSTGDAGSLSARLMGSRWHLLTPRHHNFFFRRAHLRRLLADAGLEVIEVSAWARWASVGYLAYKLGAVAPSSRAVRSISGAVRSRRAGAVVVPVNLFDVVTIVARKPSGRP